jgi:galactoside O-acetyltransferase
MTSFYTDEELAEVGFTSLGRNVKLSRRTAIYGAGRISIGDNSRIDDFCVLSAGDDGISIGRHVHVAAMCLLFGRAKITLDDFSGLSGRVSVYSSSDDYSGQFMTNPTVPDELTGVESHAVRIGKHVIVGAGSVILPGAVCNDGCAVGALSLVKGVLAENFLHSGTPARPIRERRTEMFDLEKKLLSHE